VPELDTDISLLITVGAHLKAELNDRPTAYRLLESVQDQLQRQTGGTDWPVHPIVCTDVWYLNNNELHSRPVISVGGPGVNAVSAYLYQKLPTALAVEEQLVIQLDVDFADLRCAIWGTDAGHSNSAVELFEKKYLAEYIKAVLAES